MEIARDGVSVTVRVTAADPRVLIHGERAHPVRALSDAARVDPLTDLPEVSVEQVSELLVLVFVGLEEVFSL